MNYEPSRLGSRLNVFAKAETFIMSSQRRGFQG